MEADADGGPRAGTEYFTLHEEDRLSAAPCGPEGGRLPGDHRPAAECRRPSCPAAAAPGARSVRWAEAGLAMHAAWLAWSLALAAAAACWGLRAGARPQLEAVWGEVRRLGERQAQQARLLARIDGACVTGVRGGGGSWQLFRADGSEAGSIEFGRFAGAAAGHEGTGAQHPPGSYDAGTASALPEVPVQVMQPMAAQGVAGARRLPGGGVASTQWPPPVSAPEAFPELMCQHAHRTEWQEVKVMTAQHLGSWRGGIVPQKTQDLRGVLDSAVQRLQGVQGFNTECGMGRLSMSVLAVLTDDPGRSLQGAPAVHAPLLTVLLDMPWSLIVWSGWPLFALLGQLHLHTRGRDDLPQGGAPAEYLRAAEEALLLQRPAVLAELGAAFLKKEPARPAGAAPAAPAAGAAPAAPAAGAPGAPGAPGAGRGPAGGGAAAGEAAAAAHAMPVLCALASQLLSPGLDGGDAKGAEEALRQMQGFYRQSVQSIEDLHASVISAWPLYGILHAAAVQLSTPTATPQHGMQ